MLIILGRMFELKDEDDHSFGQILNDSLLEYVLKEYFVYVAEKSLNVLCESQ